MRKTMLRLALLGAVAAVPAYAQVAPAAPDRSGTTTPAPGTERAPPAAKTDGGTRTADAPVAGANSFTESQARNRIEAAGFSGVADLQKDDQGIWRGRAQHNGQQVSVALDYQGNVSTR